MKERRASAPALTSNPTSTLRQTPGKGEKESKNAERKKQRQIAEAEARIAAIEKKMKEMEAAMQRAKGAVEMSSLGIEYALAQRELDEAMKQWENVAT